MMKMGSEYSRDEKYERVDEIIEQVLTFYLTFLVFKDKEIEFEIKLGLVKSENTLIGMGDKKKGISGGEKRRLAFASEVFYKLNKHF